MSHNCRNFCGRLVFPHICSVCLLKETASELFLKELGEKRIKNRKIVLSEDATFFKMGKGRSKKTMLKLNLDSGEIKEYDSK